MRLASRKFSVTGLLVAVGTFALLAAGCGSTTSAPSGPTDLDANQVFHYQEAGASDIATMDPDIVQDANSVPFIDLVYDQLVTQDQNLNIIPWAATKWDITNGGTTYTFHLRNNLKFSNGTPETAQDFAYSINRSQNPCLASPVNGYLAGLNGALLLKDAATFFAEKCTNGTISGSIQTLIGDSIQTPDNQTLVLTLSSPAAYFLETLTYPTSYALDPAVVGSDITNEKWQDSLSTGATGQGTGGMYYVSSWDHQAGQLVLKPNPNFWGISAGYKPFLKEIDLTVFKDADTAYAAYQAGQFDIGFPTTQLLAQAKTQPDFHQSSILEFSGFVFNWTKPPFDNLDARIAACLAINRDTIAHDIAKDASLPSWHIVPQGMPGYNPSIVGPDNTTATAGDPTKAKAHWATYLSTAGASAKKSWEYLFVSASTTQRNTAQALQGMWQDTLGVTVSLLKGEDFNTWLSDDSAGNFTATRFAWLDDYPDPQDFLSLLFHTGASYNSQKASIPAADTLMDQADVNTNTTQRLQQYNQAEQQIVNQVGFCPGTAPLQFWQSRQYLNAWTLNGGGLTSLPTWAKTYVKKH